MDLLPTNTSVEIDSAIGVQVTRNDRYINRSVKGLMRDAIELKRMQNRYEI